MANIPTPYASGASFAGSPSPYAVDEALAARVLLWSDDRKILFYDSEVVSSLDVSRMIVTQDVLERSMKPKDRSSPPADSVRIEAIPGMRNFLPPEPDFDGGSGLMILAFG